MDGALDADGAADAGAIDAGAADDGAAKLGATLTAGSVGELPVLLGVQAATAPAAAITRRIMSLFMQISHWDAHWAFGDGPLCGCQRPKPTDGVRTPTPHGGRVSLQGAVMAAPSATVVQSPSSAR
jgi:hypothetical protein